MASTTTRDRRGATENDRFRHDALFYAGNDDFVRRTGAFIDDSMASGEPILVVVSAEKIEMLRARLNGEGSRVRFADMADVGRNPARIIPAWREFVAEQTASGRPFRGIGEPIWAARSPEELDECERHEALLNLAFADSAPWWLACPYDTESLPLSVIEEAKRNHPFVVDGGVRRPSETYRGLAELARPFARPLPEPAATPIELSFGSDHDGMLAVRRLVADEAAAFGLDPVRTDDLVMAAHEIASNSVRHGGGRGALRVWREGPALICEIRDGGLIQDPMAGRGSPSADTDSGFGLWLANRLVDLVQIRTFADGSVVRLHARR